MTDIQAAVGREQLKRMPEIVAARRRIAQRYTRMLQASNVGITPPSEPDWARSNFQSYCVRLPEHCDQRAVMQVMLRRRAIATRRGIMCSHREAGLRVRAAPCRTPSLGGRAGPLHHPAAVSADDACGRGTGRN